MQAQNQYFKNNYDDYGKLGDYFKNSNVQERKRWLATTRLTIWSFKLRLASNGRIQMTLIED